MKPRRRFYCLHSHRNSVPRNSTGSRNTIHAVTVYCRVRHCSTDPSLHRPSSPAPEPTATFQGVPLPAPTPGTKIEPAPASASAVGRPFCFSLSLSRSSVCLRCPLRLSRRAGVAARTPVLASSPVLWRAASTCAAVPRPRARPSTAEPARSGLCHRTTARRQPAPSSGLHPSIGSHLLLTVRYIGKFSLILYPSAVAAATGLLHEGFGKTSSLM